MHYHVHLRKELDMEQDTRPLLMKGCGSEYTVEQSQPPSAPLCTSFIAEVQKKDGVCMQTLP
jgi:hypothetical protein